MLSFVKTGRIIIRYW